MIDNNDQKKSSIIDYNKFFIHYSQFSQLEKSPYSIVISELTKKEKSLMLLHIYVENPSIPQHYDTYIK